MTPEEIDKVDVGSIGQVFNLCQQKGQTCTGLSGQLQTPDLFARWSGSTQQAALRAVNRHRVDIDGQGSEAQLVGAAAATAEQEFQDAKNKLTEARDYIRSNGTHGSYTLELDDSTGIVSIVKRFGGAFPDIAGDQMMAQSAQIHAQGLVSAAMAAAADADIRLAAAVEAATNQIPIGSLASLPAITPGGLTRVPGVLPTYAGPTLSNATEPGTTNRILHNVPIPKNATQAEIDALGALYAPKVTLNPNDPRNIGGYSGNILPGRGADGASKVTILDRPVAGKRRGLDIEVSKGVRFRAVGATPTRYYVTQDACGNPSLGVTYKYDYQMQTQYYGDIGGAIPIIPQATWHATTTDSAVALAQQHPGKVTLPTP